jgi:hypothetical protein
MTEIEYASLLALYHNYNLAFQSLSTEIKGKFYKRLFFSVGKGNKVSAATLHYQPDYSAIEIRV